MKIKADKRTLKDLFQEIGILLAVCVGTPLIVLATCAIVFVLQVYHDAKIATITIQDTIHKQCNLVSYRAESRYYDPYPNTIYYHELDDGKTIIYCDFTSEGWKCVCDETE
jgi:hypothetical protein